MPFHHSICHATTSYRSHCHWFCLPGFSSWFLPATLPACLSPLHSLPLLPSSSSWFWFIHAFLSLLGFSHTHTHYHTHRAFSASPFLVLMWMVSRALLFSALPLFSRAADLSTDYHIQLLLAHALLPSPHGLQFAAIHMLCVTSARIFAKTLLARHCYTLLAGLAARYTRLAACTFTRFSLPAARCALCYAHLSLHAALSGSRQFLHAPCARDALSAYLSLTTHNACFACLLRGSTPWELTLPAELGSNLPLVCLLGRLAPRATTSSQPVLPSSVLVRTSTWIVSSTEYGSHRSARSWFTTPAITPLPYQFKRAALPQFCAW